MRILLYSLLLTLLGTTAEKETFFPANDPGIQYMGRVDLSNPATPRLWSPGVVVRWRFRGDQCRVVIRDEVAGGKNHNYLEIAVEGETPYRLQLKGQQDTLVIRAAGKGAHVVSLCKDTESGIGWLEMVGVMASVVTVCLGQNDGIQDSTVFSAPMYSLSAISGALPGSADRLSDEPDGG